MPLYDVHATVSVSGHCVIEAPDMEAAQIKAESLTVGWVEVTLMEEETFESSGTKEITIDDIFEAGDTSEAGKR